MMAYNNPPVFNNQQFQSFQSHDGLPTYPPSLVTDLLTPTSDMPSPREFVDPSQTFISVGYDMPQMHLSQLDTSPTSNYSTGSFSMNHSPAGSRCFTPGYSIKLEPTTPSRNPIPRPILEPLKTSRALRRVQVEGHQRSIKRKMKREDSHSLPPQIKVQKQARKQCAYPGCTSKFQRQEHLKRHEKTHRKDLDPFPCPFCTKVFSRTDNLKSHVKLHIPGDRKPSRTAVHPDAEAYYNEMHRKSRKCAGESRDHNSHVHAMR